MKVAIVGCIGIDTNVYFHGDGPNFELEGNFTQNLDYIGQAGGYTTRLFHAMGHFPMLVASIGADYHGEFIRKTFGLEGITCQGLFIDPEGTNRSINFMYPDGRRKNFYDGKSNYTLQVEPSSFSPLFDGAQGAHFHIANWCRHFLPFCASHAIPISVDLQDIVELEDEYRRDFLQAAEVVFFSLTNFQGEEEKVMMNFTKKFPAKIFVAGNGAKGCWSAQGGDVAFYPSLTQGRPIIDTNGAGDALACGVLHGLWHLGVTIGEACAIGQRLARIICSIKADSSFTFEEIQSALVSHHPHGESF